MKGFLHNRLWKCIRILTNFGSKLRFISHQVSLDSLWPVSSPCHFAKRRKTADRHPLFILYRIEELSLLY